ncbi:hypothetical protein N825_09195 [Skermanella stibiiresistens SB22]|uniref:Peptidoglycan binding-like domain-containing protein n=1 Tax=Skermanella stibiiresistens SB22 TaxID=1385369 RepID=W9GV26_9PROT|nr:cellulose biosynthesis protein BcsN [Skermanella stibiiresistens]EWY37745.1 hypothetical protein N825_09195 [Skermanella stibiiresistens SB22]
MVNQIGRRSTGVRRVIKAALSLSLLASTAACTAWYDPEAQLPSSQSWRRVAQDDVPVIFTEDHPLDILAARRQTYGKLTEIFELTLENPTILPGENSFRLEIRHRPTSMLTSITTLSEPFATPRYDQRVLTVKLEQEFPTLQAKIQPDLRVNRYGMYSYATATDGIVGCVLAWQVIDDSERVLPPMFKLLRSEYRFCAPDKKPGELLEAFDTATLFFNGNMMPSIETGASYLGHRDEIVPPSERGEPPVGRSAPRVKPESPTLSISTRGKSSGDIPLGRASLLDLDNATHAETVQRLLQGVGLYEGRIDGIWGPQSRKALKLFKAANGLPANDGWDAAVQRRMGQLVPVPGGRYGQGSSSRGPFQTATNLIRVEE